MKTVSKSISDVEYATINHPTGFQHKRWL